MQKLPDASALTPEQLIERWTRWLEETQKEAFRLYSSRFLFENVQRMFKSNPELAHSGSHVLEWMFRNFYTEYLISVRKEMESGRNYLTLVNFLIELEKHSESVLTRKRYVALYLGSALAEGDIASWHFDEKHGAMCNVPRTCEDQDCISSASVRRTREQLENDTQLLVDYANWYLAHRTQARTISVTLRDMYIGMNRIFDVYARYHNVITAASWMGKFPTHQYDWAAPFKLAWITEEFQPFEPPD